MLTGVAKFACCQPEEVSALKVVLARRVPVLDHKCPEWVPVLDVPL